MLSNSNRGTITILSLRGSRCEEGRFLPDLRATLELQGLRNTSLTQIEEVRQAIFVVVFGVFGHCCLPFFNDGAVEDMTVVPRSNFNNPHGTIWIPSVEM